MRKHSRGGMILAILAVGWLGLMAVLRERVISPIYADAPQQAARMVLAKYDQDAAGIVWRERDLPKPTDSLELTGLRDSQALYRVRLQRMRGLHGSGWQELEYERLGQP